MDKDAIAEAMKEMCASDIVYILREATQRPYEYAEVVDCYGQLTDEAIVAAVEKIVSL